MCVCVCVCVCIYTHACVCIIASVKVYMYACVSSVKPVSFVRSHQIKSYPTCTLDVSNQRSLHLLFHESYVGYVLCTFQWPHLYVQLEMDPRTFSMRDRLSTQWYQAKF